MPLEGARATEEGSRNFGLEFASPMLTVTKVERKDFILKFGDDFRSPSGWT